ncbi:hypothetical protein, partial [Rhizorhabdus histidinilytica]|uniref:hypothetical protein n=1 Tax=Rhizorhabdus histidinilytica TaxID=439228 RepID=UPI001C378C66
TLEMAPLEIRHRSVRPISAKHAQASRFLQQSHRQHHPCPDSILVLAEMIGDQLSVDVRRKGRDVPGEQTPEQ